MPSTSCTCDTLAQLVDRVGLGLGDDVVGSGHVLGRDDAGDGADLLGHLGGLADLALDEQVGLNGHGSSLGRVTVRREVIYP